MGNEYRLYEDRIELDCNFPFFRKTIVVKRDDLVSISVFKPPVLKTSLRALKLDTADFHEHVGLTRKVGFFKQLRFTPENPEEFVAKARQLLGVRG